MAAPIFIADPGDAIRLVTLDGLSALYHRPSGTTHIVAPPAPEILEALREGPANVADLLNRLRARYDLEERADEAIGIRLIELEQAGLVRRA